MARKTAKRQRRSRKHKKQRRHSRKLGGGLFNKSLISRFFGRTPAPVAPETPAVAEPVAIPTAVGSMVAPEATVIECEKDKIYEMLIKMNDILKKLKDNDNGYDNIFRYLFSKIKFVIPNENLEVINNLRNENELDETKTKEISNKIYREEYELNEDNLQNIQEVLSNMVTYAKDVNDLVENNKNACFRNDIDEYTFYILNQLNTLIRLYKYLPGGLLKSVPTDGLLKSDIPTDYELKTRVLLTIFQISTEILKFINFYKTINQLVPHK